jgi:hypothetical protein
MTAVVRDEIRIRSPEYEAQVQATALRLLYHILRNSPFMILYNTTCRNSIIGSPKTTAKTMCKVKLSRYTPWSRLGKRSYSSSSFLISAPDGGQWSASRPGRVLPQHKGSIPLTHWIGGWVGPRDGLDAEKPFAPTGYRFQSSSQ